MPNASISGGHPALTDEQTGLPNRLHFDTVLGTLFATAQRGLPLSLIMLEIDSAGEWLARTDSPEVNRVMKSIGQTLVPVIRQMDLLARADEGCFAACLIDCNMAGAVLVADRFDALLDSIRSSSELGFSIGGATFDPDMASPSDLFGAAEESLRAAQSRGGNQMEFRR
ncbi:MAG: GGDEF domain-containing protein [Gemmatimonadetes bacterium]|nr:GGDEF domain-containing protein [Gemmatimonadota bacterium]NNM04862.1 GGDEF domain-containing protein [Gemmatimonadota bacterium]